VKWRRNDATVDQLKRYTAVAVIVAENRHKQSLNDNALFIHRKIKAVIEKNRCTAFGDLPSLKIHLKNKSI